jgi:hypothetical protein
MVNIVFDDDVTDEFHTEHADAFREWINNNPSHNVILENGQYGVVTFDEAIVM